jgi:hypothetical protein
MENTLTFKWLCDVDGWGGGGGACLFNLYFKIAKHALNREILGTK